VVKWWWRGKTEEYAANLSQCHFVHHMNWPERETKPLPWEDDD
jgi:hypothetical protein